MSRHGQFCASVLPFNLPLLARHCDETFVQLLNERPRGPDELTLQRYLNECFLIALVSSFSFEALLFITLTKSFASQVMHEACA